MTTRSKLSIALLALGISLSAMAMDLGQAMSALGGAKAQGLVGEQADGYLGVVSNSGQAADIAAQINAARRAEYQKVANSSGASLADVEAMAGKKAMEKPCRAVRPYWRQVGEEIARRLCEPSGTLLRSQGPGSVRGIFPVAIASPRDSCRFPWILRQAFPKKRLPA